MNQESTEGTRILPVFNPGLYCSCKNFGNLKLAVQNIWPLG